MEFMGIDVTLYALIAVAAALIVAIVALILVIVQFKKLKKQKSRLDVLMEGTEHLDLESSLTDKFKRLNDVEERQKVSEKDIRIINRKLEKTYQKVAIERYDAYMENGGKLSFALAMLDESDDGFILNVMTGNDGSFCYAKSIINGQSEIQLGREEAKALEKAMAK